MQRRKEETLAGIHPFQRSTLVGAVVWVFACLPPQTLRQLLLDPRGLDVFT